MQKTSRTLVCLASLLAGLLPACSEEEDVVADQPGAPAPTNPPPDNPPATQTVELTAVEYSFSPSVLTVRPGVEVTFVLHNGGTMPHALDIELPDGEVELEGTVAPGAMGQVTAMMPDETGDFDFYCPIIGHRELGMEGTLQVRQGASTMSD
jgi:uncharacterized cupredoxin-like copper-binding protein